MSRWSLVAEEGHQLPRGSWEWHPQLTSLRVDGALGAEYNPQEWGVMRRLGACPAKDWGQEIL